MPRKSKQEEAQETGAQETEKYCDADVVEQIARRLIPVYHPEIATANIKFVFKTKTSMKHGRPVLGSAKRVSGIWNYLTEYDFLLEIAMTEWGPMPLEQREALVDHLLERCTGIEDEKDAGAPMKWSVREPDVHEFSSILGRRGAWNADLQVFCNVIQQGVDIPGLVNSVEADDIVQNA
jgi:hypothetical protein